MKLLCATDLQPKSDAAIDRAFLLRGALDALAAGETTSVALTEAFLDGIARLNPRLNAYVTVTAEAALAQAEAAVAQAEAQLGAAEREARRVEELRARDVASPPPAPSAASATAASRRC